MALSFQEPEGCAHIWYPRPQRLQSARADNAQGLCERDAVEAAAASSRCVRSLCALIAELI